MDFDIQTLLQWCKLYRNKGML